MKFLNIALIIASATASGLRRRVPSLFQASSGDCNDVYCTQQFDPVCGSDGETYSNACTFGIAACNYAAENPGAAALTYSEGSCGATEAPTTPCADFCPAIYEPVCGFNGLTYVTYGNACQFGAFACNYANDNPGAAALTSTEGACPLEGPLEGEDTVQASEACDNRCTREYAPVCGSNGVTYGNACVFDNAACEYAAANEGAAALSSTDGECDDCVCAQIFAPVCGSDGETYSNPCELGCAAEDSLIEITSVCDGTCPCAE